MRPAQAENAGLTTALPAATKWLKTRDGSAIFTTHLEKYSALVLPYELVVSSTNPLDGPIRQFTDYLLASSDPVQNYLAGFLQAQCRQLSSAPTSGTRFLRFDAPLALLMAGFKFNAAAPSSARLKQLYIAQAPLNTLPRELQDDVPTPSLVKDAGKGDIYDSSVWIGLEPTYTPWHRDPNPNLFHQLWSTKEVRLLPPRRGEHIFLQAWTKLGNGGTSRIRGAEMMEGAERQVLLDAIWGPDAPGDILSVDLSPGDALFIPKGWWHSIRSIHGDGGPNASVNWWFR